MATPRKIYNTVSKTIILNVFKYFKDESLKFPPNHPQRSYLKKTAEVTGLHHRTISWIFQSAKTSTASSSAAQMPVPTTPALSASSNAAQVETAPSATRKEHSRAIVLDDFDKCAIRRTIQEFYTVRKQLPTMDKLLAVLRVEINSKGCRDTLRKIVRSLGFRKATCQPDRYALIEKDRIVNMRAAYLRKMKKYR